MSDSSPDSSLVTEQVKQQAQQAVQQTQNVAGQAIGQAKSALDSRKDQSADTLTQTAQALRQTGQDLRQNNGGVPAGIMESAADQIDRTAEYLRGRSVSELVTEAENYARSNTAIFLGGAFALGLLAARFLKSSPPSSQPGSSAPYGGSASQYGGYRSGAAGPGWASYSGEYSRGTLPYGYEDVSGTRVPAQDYAPNMTEPQSYGLGSAGGESDVR